MYDTTFVTEFIMLAMLLSIGIYVGYVDLKSRLVPNKYNFVIFLTGLIGNLILISEGVIGYKLSLTILGVAMVIGVLLYMLNFWGPGDAKFFVSAAISLPPTLFAHLKAVPIWTAPAVFLLNAVCIYLIVLGLDWTFKRLDISGSSNNSKKLMGTIPFGPIIVASSICTVFMKGSIIISFGLSL